MRRRKIEVDKVEKISTNEEQPRISRLGDAGPETGL